MAGEFSAVCLFKGCGKSYTGITKKNARQNLSEHIKRVHKLSLVEYRREYEAPEAMAQREAVQQRREARRESAWRGPDGVRVDQNGYLLGTFWVPSGYLLSRKRGDL